MQYEAQLVRFFGSQFIHTKTKKAAKRAERTDGAHGATRGAGQRHAQLNVCAGHMRQTPLVRVQRGKGARVGASDGAARIATST
jgi:hypothetical protein